MEIGLYVEYCLYEIGTDLVLRRGNSSFEVKEFNQNAIETIRKMLHTQSVAACNESYWSTPHRLATEELSYLELNFTRLDK